MEEEPITQEVQALRTLVADLTSEVQHLSETFATSVLALKEGTTLVTLTLPLFDGLEDPFPWLSRCEHLFKLHGISEEGKMAYIPCYLTGATQAWFAVLSKSHPDITWKAFQVACIQRYGEYTAALDLSDLLKLKKNGDLETYNSKFERIAAGIKSLDNLDYVVQIYIYGLQEPLSSYVGLMRPKTINEAMKWAREARFGK